MSKIIEFIRLWLFIIGVMLTKTPHHVCDNCKNNGGVYVRAYKTKNNKYRKLVCNMFERRLNRIIYRFEKKWGISVKTIAVNKDYDYIKLKFISESKLSKKERRELDMHIKEKKTINKPSK